MGSRRKQSEEGDAAHRRSSHASRRTEGRAKEGARTAGAHWMEEELLERCLAHEEGAWQEFLRRYSRLIYATIHRVDLPQRERDDVFQAAVAAIYKDLEGLRSSEKLVSWIVGITWRQAINSIRKRPREVTLEEAQAGVVGAIGRPDPGPLPDEARIRLERAQQAHEALQALSGRCRRLLTYFFYDDPQPSYTEIARRERIPIGSLGPTRARCLARMRSYFERRGWL